MSKQSELVSDLGELERKYPRQMRPDWVARIVTLSVVISAAALFVFAFYRFQFSLSSVSGGFARLFGFIELMFPPSPGTQLGVLMNAMAETLAIAFLGTLLAALFAFPIGLAAASNVLPNWIAHFFLRRGMDTMRSVDTLIWALIWINVVGLGPFAGILAIATTDVGALAKLFSETIENVDRKPAEGVIAAGGGPLTRIRFGLLPEAAPVMISQVLYFIESNTRSATIVGIVGAGGIGLYITESIRTLEWDRASFIIILILAAVAGIDFLSSRLRHFISGSSVAPFEQPGQGSLRAA